MAEQVDELFDVKSAFYVGAYQQCIKNCQTARLSDPALAVEKDGYMYRAYLAQVSTKWICWILSFEHEVFFGNM